MSRWLPVLSLSLLLSVPTAQAADLYGGGSDLPDELRTLLSASDPSRRREGVEKLQALPQRLAAPYLLQRLQDGDAAVRARAAQALGPTQMVAAAPALLDGLSDADSVVRAACAEAMGQFAAIPSAEQQRAVTQLSRAMGDSQFEVRQEALRAVERLIAAQVFQLTDLPQLLGPVLLRAEDENVGVRRSALAVLGRLSPLKLPSELRSRVLLSLIGRLSDPARDVRAEALRSLGLLRAQNAASAALRLLRDPAEEVRRQAMLCLGRLASESAIPLLRESLETGTEAQRTAAVQALGQYLLPDAAATVSVAVQRQAAQAILGSLEQPSIRPLVLDVLLAGSDRVAPLLLSELTRPTISTSSLATVVELIRDLGPKLSEPQRSMASAELIRELWRSRLPKELLLDALASVGDRSITPLLGSLLTDKEAQVRRKAIELLRLPTLSDRRSLDAILVATTDSDPQVQKLALLALGDLGQGQPRLLEVLDPTDRPALADVELRKAAAHALLAQAQQGQLSDAAVAMLMRTVLTVRPGLPEQRLRRTAAQALSVFLSSRPERHAPILAELLSTLRKSPESGPHSEVLLLLSGILRGHKSETVQERLLSLSQLAADPQSSEGQLAVDALSALQSFVDLSAQSRLAKLLSHRDPVRVQRAIQAQGMLVASQPSDALIAVLTGLLEEGQGSDLRATSEAAWALSHLPRNHAATQRVVDRLRALLLPKRDASPELVAIRTNVLAALARLGTAEPRDAEWLDDADAGVRRNAALLIGALVPRPAGLEARLRNLAALDEDATVRKNAEAALQGRAPQGPASRKHWLISYHSDFDGKIRPLAPYRLILSDGITRAGYSDRVGSTHEERLPDGPCQVELLPSSPPPR